MAQSPFFSSRSGTESISFIIRSKRRRSLIQLPWFYVGVAVSAGQRIAQQRDGEISWSLGNSGDEVVIIRLRGNRDDCVVPDTIGARRELHAQDAVSVAVAEFFGRKVIA